MKDIIIFILCLILLPILLGLYVGTSGGIDPCDDCCMKNFQQGTENYKMCMQSCNFYAENGE